MTGILIFLAALLVFVVLIQIARTSELMSIIKGEDESSEDNSKVQAGLMLGFMVLGLIASVWSAIYFSDRYLPESASAHGAEIDSMFNVTLILTGIVFVITQIMLFWFAYKYRYKKGRKVYYYPENNKLEVTWTIIPAIVMTFLVVQGLTAWYNITGEAPAERIEFEATGKQFGWMIRYPGADGELGEQGPRNMVSPTNEVGINWEDPASRDDFMSGEIVLPVNTPAVVRINALDVLHSFYLPHFRVKMDAVPGTPTKFWFTPTITTAEMREKLGDPEFNYELACAELCGRGHSSMRLVVRIVSMEEFDAWSGKQTPYYEQVGAADVEITEPQAKESDTETPETASL